MRCRQSLSILFLDRWLGQTARGRLEDKGSRSLEVSTGHAHRQPAAPVPLRLRTVLPPRRSNPQSELVSLVALPFVNYFSGKFRLVSSTGYPSASNVSFVLSGQVFWGVIYYCTIFEQNERPKNSIKQVVYLIKIISLAEGCFTELMNPTSNKMFNLQFLEARLV